MTAPAKVAPSQPRDCRNGCGTRIILARPTGSARWAAYDAADQPPFTEQAAGCHVLVTGEAWRPLDLIEHFRVRFEITEAKARDLVAGYPFHRPHHHCTTDPDTTEGDQL